MKFLIITKFFQKQNMKKLNFLYRKDIFQFTWKMILALQIVSKDHFTGATRMNKIDMLYLNFEHMIGHN